MNKPTYKPSRVVIIGAGAVGTTTAYTLLLRQRMTELVLIDVNHKKALGEALDMNHGLPFVGGVKLWAGNYEDCADADIIIVTAGVSQKPGETRIDLLQRNVDIFKDIIQKVTQYNKDGILLIATNPVDILSYATWKISGWDHRRIIGSGTLLDSARFRYLIGSHKEIDPRSVHGHIIGEHGDSELPVWSLANLAGSPLDFDETERNNIFEDTKNAAYEVIDAKGSTSYAIALALDRIVAAILLNESTVLSVSTLLHNFNSVSDVYLGVPSIINRSGVHQVLDLPLNQEEETLFKQSADKVKSEINKLSL